MFKLRKRFHMKKWEEYQNKKSIHSLWWQWWDTSSSVSSKKGKKANLYLIVGYESPITNISSNLTFFSIEKIIISY